MESFFEVDINLIVQGLIAAIIIGMAYMVWVTTRAYGGLIGKSLRLLAYGMLFITVAVIEKMLLNFSVVERTANLDLIQDVFNLIGLALLLWGFSKLAAASRA